MDSGTRQDANTRSEERTRQPILGPLTAQGWSWPDSHSSEHSWGTGGFHGLCGQSSDLCLYRPRGQAWQPQLIHTCEHSRGARHCSGTFPASPHLIISTVLTGRGCGHTRGWIKAVPSTNSLAWLTVRKVLVYASDMHRSWEWVWTLSTSLGVSLLMTHVPAGVCVCACACVILMHVPQCLWKGPTGLWIQIDKLSREGYGGLSLIHI